MKAEHYEALAAALQPVFAKHSPASYRAAGLSEKRFRWDALWAIQRSEWVCRELYPYLNDDHIDSALKQMVEEHYGSER
jgi:hypothetical protein